MSKPQMNRSNRPFGDTSYGRYVVLAASLLLVAAGCQDTNNTKALLTDQVQKLSLEKVTLAKQVEQVNAENQQLKDRIEVLSALPKDQIEPWSLQKIDLGRFTGLYDQDKDGKKEQLIVYIQPIDQDGDTVKSPGAVEVQLWDLNKADSNALLGEWHVGPDQLRKLWLTTLLASNYRLTFDVGEKVSELKEPLTVKVTFTDYLTGKTFQEQKVIKP
jgi:hypothetical protein